MDIAQKKALVAGLGRSGIAAAVFLKKRGARVTAVDMSPEHELEASMNPLRSMNIALEFGTHRIESFLSADFIVISPGVPLSIPPLKAAKEKGIPVMGELELASRFIAEPIIAVTGTNGKTTTTEMIGDMLKQSGHTVFVGGNIGNPLIGYADNRHPSDSLVVEVSSFQLDTIETFRPHISVLLNISPDHLDRYDDFEAYIDAKGRIFKNQTKADCAVLNGSDEQVRRISGKIAPQKLFFTGCSDQEYGAAISDTGVHFRLSSADQTLNQATSAVAEGDVYLPLDRRDFQCRHVRENIAAAGLAALAAGATVDGIERALKMYRGQAHRLEYIGMIDGIPYYNDSKATNVDAVLRALECIAGAIVLIMGGRNKGYDFGALANLVKQKVSLLILLGEAAGEIEAALKHSTKTKKVTSMAEAVDEAHASAQAGETVLFSPACASFDMYKNYQDRGDSFRREMQRISHRVMQ